MEKRRRSKPSHTATHRTAPHRTAPHHIDRFDSKSFLASFGDASLEGFLRGLGSGIRNMATDSYTELIANTHTRAHQINRSSPLPAEITLLELLPTDANNG